ncbi:Nucleolar protein 4 [Frankliniella fusca]|uniref:Nucleolar protein 4 n=1 Tax=Frankliniella fusca TaxID=407009 RepID=A0AAE1LRY7_9NEOP|nr:Nucleolar protein 4 [Frankliniella fusca]
MNGYVHPSSGTAGKPIPSRLVHPTRPLVLVFVFVPIPIPVLNFALILFTIPSPSSFEDHAMQSAVLAMTTASASSRLSHSIPAASMAQPLTQPLAQLGPSPAIPTLKQLQDIHTKAKQVPAAAAAANNNNTTANNNNNNNNYKSLAVPPVVLKLTTDAAGAAEQATPKRSYAVSDTVGGGGVSAPSAHESAVKKPRLDAQDADYASNKKGGSGGGASTASSLALPPAPAPPPLLSEAAGGALVLPPPPLPPPHGVLLGMERPPLSSVLQYSPYLGLPLGPPGPGSPLGPLGGPLTALVVPPPRPPSVSSADLTPLRPPSAGPSSSSSSRPSSAGPSSSASSSASPRPRSHPPHASPLRGKHKAIRQQAMEENREGLLDCVKHVPENFQSVLRQHILMQMHLGRTRAAAGHSLLASMSKAEMIASYQPWVILTYGDAAKTKTITLSKYARIVRTLRGEEVNSAENSKFRFWVRSKGFRLGAPEPDGHPRKPADDILGSYGVDTRSGHMYICADEVGHPTHPVDAPPLYVPTGTSKSCFPLAFAPTHVPGGLLRRR